jgi:hypothetical protein
VILVAIIVGVVLFMAFIFCYALGQSSAMADETEAKMIKMILSNEYKEEEK